MFSTSKRDQVFYGAFAELAASMVEAAKLLVETFENVDRAVELAKTIKEIEHTGDRITHETVKRLHKTWITPLDRTDIHALIEGLDDILDLTDAVSDRIALFDIDEVPNEALELAQVLVRSCLAIERAVKLLPTLDKASEILDICVEINHLEKEADVIYRRILTDLYHGGTKSEPEGRYHPLYVLKWRDIFDHLETATDRCEDLANILEGVVLEYA